MADEDILSKYNQGKLIKKLDDGKTNQEYLKGEIFGKGGFSICYKAYSLNEKKEVLIKELKDCENYVNEARIHSTLKHDNIVKYYDDIKEENGNESKLYLILEFCENRDLASLKKKRIRLTEIEVQYYIRNLIEALKYLHEERNIVHCDLKPGNIFLTDKLEVKLGDFGLAKRITSDYTPSNNGGTIYYMAPESLKKSKCSYKVDIWAIGIIIYELLTGNLPFYADKNKRDEIEAKINSCKFDFPSEIVISKIAKDLIRQILVKDPNKRPTLSQIKEHDFFTMGRAIPKLLPKAFINKAPSIEYIRNFIVDADENGINNNEPKKRNLYELPCEADKNLQNDNNKNKDKNIYVKEIFINKNYINKYGLAYILSNDFYGVCFRDSTKIVYSPKTNKGIYFKNGEKIIFNINNLEDIKKELNEKEKRDLEKKVKLLQYFMDYKTKNISSSDFEKNPPRNINRNEIDDDISEDNPIFVKHYYIMDNSPIVLRLNNKNIQVYFNSNENILLSKDNKEATFIKKDKSELKSNVFQFDNAMEAQNLEIVKKLQYTKSLLGKIINDDNQNIIIRNENFYN